MYDVLIVGAGPVGLLLGNLLGELGKSVLILERRLEIPKHSRAIGIVPPSLVIAESIGLIDRFLENGLRIEGGKVHDETRCIGAVSFRETPSRFPHILSLPQSKTEEILEAGLTRYPHVELLRGCEVFNVRALTGGMEVSARRVCRVEPQTALQFPCRFLCGCDGKYSVVRRSLGYGNKTRRYRETFLMADYAGSSGLADTAYLFFTPSGSVESFPLPEGKRRWIIQTAGLREHPEPAYHALTVRQRTGIELDPSRKTWESPFRPERTVASAFAGGFAALCGDAAHTMSPIGGQGMNTGFADAALLARVIGEIQKGHTDSRALLKGYQRVRRRAARVAARRAWISMKIGTTKGCIPSYLRNQLVRLLAKTRLKKAVVRHFTMLSVPYHSVAQGTAALGLSPAESQPHERKKQ